MNERAVRAAVERLAGRVGAVRTGQASVLIPVAAITALVEAVAAEPDELPEDVPTDRPPVT